MDRVTRCLHCRKLLVSALDRNGRTELKCVFCDKVDPMEIEAATKWAGSSLAISISEPVP
jgi:phage FluMu protein Com